MMVDDIRWSRDISRVGGIARVVWRRIDSEMAMKQPTSQVNRVTLVRRRRKVGIRSNTRPISSEEDLLCVYEPRLSSSRWGSSIASERAHDGCWPTKPDSNVGHQHISTR